jgi:hypothetical protein
MQGFCGHSWRRQCPLGQGNGKVAAAERAMILLKWNCSCSSIYAHSFSLILQNQKEFNNSSKTDFKNTLPTIQDTTLGLGWRRSGGGLRITSWKDRRLSQDCHLWGVWGAAESGHFPAISLSPHPTPTFILSLLYEQEAEVCCSCYPWNNWDH